MQGLLDSLYKIYSGKIPMYFIYVIDVFSVKFRWRLICLQL